MGKPEGAAAARAIAAAMPGTAANMASTLMGCADGQQVLGVLGSNANLKVSSWVDQWVCPETGPTMTIPEFLEGADKRERSSSSSSSGTRKRKKDEKRLKKAEDEQTSAREALERQKALKGKAKEEARLKAREERLKAEKKRNLTVEEELEVRRKQRERRAKRTIELD